MTIVVPRIANQQMLGDGRYGQASGNLNQQYSSAQDPQFQKQMNDFRAGGMQLDDGRGNRPLTVEETTSMNNQPFPNQQTLGLGYQYNPNPGEMVGMPQIAHMSGMERQLPPTPSNPPTLPPQIGQQQFGGFGAGSGIGSLGGGGGGGQTNVSLNLQGSATMNPQGANQNRGYPGMNFASAQDQSRGTMMYAEGGPAQQGVGSLDRGRTGIREIDIIRTYLVHLGMKPEQVPQMIQAAVKDGAKFTRVGNTMMSMKPISQNAAQVYFYTVSKMPEFMDEVKGFIDKLKQSGISVIYMNKEDRDIMQAIQAAGASVQQSDRPEFKIMAGI